MLPLHYEERGDGPVVVLLHGLFGSLANWRGVARHLSSRFRVVSADLRNHGRSPHDADHSHRAMSEDVLSLLDSLGVSAARLVGHSLGGKVAMTCALSHPQRVAKLVVVDITAAGSAARAEDPPSQADPRRALEAMRGVDLASCRDRTAVVGELERRLAERGLAEFLAMNVETARPEGTLRWRIDLDALAAAWPQLAAPVQPMAPFDKPALLVRGGRSAFVRDADLAEMRRLLPRLQVACIEDAGHWVATEAPRAFRAVLDDFL